MELFFGDTNPAETRVYARLASECGTSLREVLHVAERRATLSGQLTGPYCQYAQTLPATIPLVDLGPGQSLLAQAVVPDPCFWTPELPFLYRARVELRLGGEVLQAVERPLGVRPLGSRGRRFYYEGKPWVLRGVHRPDALVSDLREFREADAALFVDDPDEELCVAASQEGVLMVANIRGDYESLEQNIRRLARHACVGFIVLDDLPDDLNPRTLAPNVVFVQRVDRSPRPPSRWANALLCNAPEHLADSILPLIAFRPENGAKKVAQRRAMCDALQRDLAGAREIAGYMV